MFPWSKHSADFSKVFSLIKTFQQTLMLPSTNSTSSSPLSGHSVVPAMIKVNSEPSSTQCGAQNGVQSSSHNKAQSSITMSIQSRRNSLHGVKSPQFEYELGLPVSSSLVFVPETMRTHWISKLLIEGDHPVMLTGFAGTGKSVLVRKLLSELNEDDYINRAINFNYYTTSAALQAFLESAIEMKSGKLYAPPGQKKCVFFIDDINMPMIDTYFTQEPMTLLRQHMDYEHWYDRTSLTIKDVKNINYVACMNPTSGSFTIDSRLQRHFSTLAMSIPSDNSVKQILSALLDGHMNAVSFKKEIRDVCPKIIDSLLAISKDIASNFRQIGRAHV